MSNHITRLTPNFLCWDKPSGRDGKCNGELFESQYGFGWEEWLLKDYHANKNKPEYLCAGFIQAFHGKNQQIGVVSTLHLFTRVVNNRHGIPPGSYYIGRIENVKVGVFPTLNQSQIKSDLLAVGITRFPVPPKCNVQFAVKDVHIKCSKDFMQYPIQLAQGQGRFGLYDWEKHQNLKKQINKYTK